MSNKYTQKNRLNAVGNDSKDTVDQARSQRALVLLRRVESSFVTMRLCNESGDGKKKSIFFLYFLVDISITVFFFHFCLNRIYSKIEKHFIAISFCFRSDEFFDEQ